MSKKYVPSNPSGVINVSKPENNVFEFIRVFKSNLLDLETTKTVKCLNSDGQIYERQFQDETRLEIQPLADSFIDAFEDYLLTGDYKKSDMDLSIIKLKLDGKKTSEIRDELGMPLSTIRTRYSRITKNVYRAVFNQERPLRGLVELESVKVIQKAYAGVRNAKLDFSLKGCMNYTQYTAVSKKLIKSNTSGVVHRGEDFNEDEYLKALRFYLLYSNDVFNYYLNSISPDMLTLVKKDLESDRLDSKARTIYAETLTNIPSFLEDSESIFKYKVTGKDCTEASVDNEDDNLSDLIQGLAVNKSLADLLVSSTKRYLDRAEKMKASGVVPKPERLSTEDSKQEVKDYLYSLTEQAIKNKISILNSYDLVNELIANYIIPNGINSESL